MDSTNPSSAPKKSKLARTISKVIRLPTPTINSNCYNTQKPKSVDKEDRIKCWPFDQEVDANAKSRNMAAMEAFVAKLFAAVSSIKAAYAELQEGQFPYNGDVIQTADGTVVNELKVISELKRSYLKKQLDISPHVTLLLAEIQEQQSLMKTYEVTLRKMEAEAQLKDSKINSLKKELDASLSTNKSIEKTLNSSGCFSVLAGVRFQDLNPSHFAQVLHYTSRTVRSFVKLMIKEMESAKWDIDAATISIEPNVCFAKQSHKCFAFEAFVWRNMIAGFNNHYFSLINELLVHQGKHQNIHFFEEFTRLRSVNPKQYLSVNPNSAFAKFVRIKYLNLVHPKMECSLFGNLNQRGLVNAGKCPDSAFYTVFVEMAKRVWVLHCLGFSFETGVGAFQVGKNSRFSEVYMECVTTEDVIGTPDGDLRVGFTVVPGFNIGKSSLIQCQVYLSTLKNH